MGKTTIHITDNELAVMYLDEGLSGREIAERLGCSPAAICLRMKAAGIKARDMHDYPPTQKQIDAWKRNEYIKAKLKMLRNEMFIKPTEEEIEHLYSLKTSVAIDNAVHSIIDRHWEKG